MRHFLLKLVPVKLGSINPVYGWVKKMKLNLLKRILSVVLTSTFLLSFNIGPTMANGVTQICWSWSMQGVITGTFTTNAPSGGMTGANIASGSYTVSDFAVLTSSIGRGTEAPVGSISNLTYSIDNPRIAFIWDGSDVNQFSRNTGNFINGFAISQTGGYSLPLFQFNMLSSEFLVVYGSNYYSSKNPATLTPLNDGVCTSGGGDGGGPSGNAEASPWVGDQNITCPTPNPWVKEQLGFASNAKPVLVSAENTIGKTITQGSYDALKSSGVVFDTVSTKVSTATETLPIYGCKDKLLSGKVNQPIQFIAGGYTLQSDAHGYINTSDLKWHDTNGVTLYTNTAAFMHTIKFTKAGKYVVVLTEQPDTSRGLIPTYGVRSVRFVININ
jgi:hypothetical protein